MQHTIASPYQSLLLRHFPGAFELDLGLPAGCDLDRTPAETDYKAVSAAVEAGQIGSTLFEILWRNWKWDMIAGRDEEIEFLLGKRAEIDALLAAVQALPLDEPEDAA
jgi:hypothetical protein